MRLSNKDRELYSQRYIDTELFGLEEHEYIKVKNSGAFGQMLALFHLVEMKPLKYQIGHKFYDIARRSYFVARKSETIVMCEKLMGTRILWIPSVDELLAHAYQNNMNISFFMSRNRRVPKSYKVLVHDAYMPENGDQEISRYVSDNHYFAVAFSLALAYKRRIESRGIETLAYPIYTDDIEFENNPVNLTDHGRKPSDFATKENMDTVRRNDLGKVKAAAKTEAKIKSEAEAQL